MSTTATKIAKIDPAAAEGGAEAEEKAPKSKKKLILIVVVLLLVAGAAWFFVLKPKAPTAPKPGEIATLESTQINLAGGHYLKIGLALQMVEGAKAVDGSKALDAAIDLFSGRSVAEVSRPKDRHDLKAKLVDELTSEYDDEVMGVYFTEYVTQ